MTHAHDQAIDGAVKNLMSNRLNADQIVELCAQYGCSVHKDGDLGASRETLDLYSRLIAAIRANLRPRPDKVRDALVEACKWAQGQLRCVPHLDDPDCAACSGRNPLDSALALAAKEAE